MIKSPTELTTGATDLFLAIECFFILIYLWRAPADERWKTSLWSWVFGLLAFSSFLGAMAHGLEMRDSISEVLWIPLYLSLGIVVALFVVGAIFDLAGRGMAKRLVLPGIAAGFVFLGLVQFFDGLFIIFVIYEAIALVFALSVYSFLSVSRRLKGAGIIALAILLTIAAAGVQASHASMNIFIPFDHNGLFHLIQIPAMAMLGWGLKIGMKTESVH